MRTRAIDTRPTRSDFSMNALQFGLSILIDSGSRLCTHYNHQQKNSKLHYKTSDLSFIIRLRIFIQFHSFYFLILHVFCNSVYILNFHKCIKIRSQLIIFTRLLQRIALSITQSRYPIQSSHRIVKRHLPAPEFSLIIRALTRFDLPPSYSPWTKGHFPLFHSTLLLSEIYILTDSLTFDDAASREGAEKSQRHRIQRAEMGWHPPAVHGSFTRRTVRPRFVSEVVVVAYEWGREDRAWYDKTGPAEVINRSAQRSGAVFGRVTLLRAHRSDFSFGRGEYLENQSRLAYDFLASFNELDPVPYRYAEEITDQVRTQAPQGHQEAVDEEPQSEKVTKLDLLALGHTRPRDNLSVVVYAVSGHEKHRHVHDVCRREFRGLRLDVLLLRRVRGEPEEREHGERNDNLTDAATQWTFVVAVHAAAFLHDRGTMKGTHVAASNENKIHRESEERGRTCTESCWREERFAIEKISKRRG
ncbi:uncharacterized protein LOC143186653 [Calliopsis andreniformis]|uniref:uncharacterized protein LOC143186653 n=1 Tax=Calliopsis andreniformis TaxID=337506 RepID=UPI003FCCE851